MRRFVIFLLAAIALDQALGAGLGRLYRRTAPDDRNGLINYALQQDPDVLVFGSSRAVHHVVPSILRARLSGTVFNAGIDGHDFLYAVMLLDLWSRSQRAPKIIILHVDPRSLSRSEEELERTSVFSPYFYESETVRHILLMRGRYERMKYLSSSYRFNGKVLPMLRGFAASPRASVDGYVGLEGTINMDVPYKRDDRDGPAPFWDVKLQYLQQIVQYSKENKSRLFLITSPVFVTNPAWRAWSTEMSQLVNSYPGVDFLDLSERTHPELFAGRPDLFSDGTHLNAKGAAVFSALLAEEVAGRMPADTATPGNP